MQDATYTRLAHMSSYAHADRQHHAGRDHPHHGCLRPHLYMRRFVLGWKTLGHEGRLRAYIVNYADDFVICCRGTADQAMAAMREMMQRLRLTVNEQKTRQCRAWDESFEFLGYTIGRCYSPQTGRSYLGTKPSKKAISRLCGEISELTGRRWGFMDTEEQVARINRKLEGWSNYFRIGPVSKVYRAVDQHTADRLRQWLCRKHKVQGAGKTRYPYRYLYEKLNLVRLEVRRRNLTWAKA
jgi:RNA-directed DNA polymerase